MDVMNPVYYAIVRRVLPGSIAPTKNTENLEVMGLLSGDKFYFVNHLKMNGFRFGDGDPPTNIQVVMHTKRFLRNIEEDHVILRGHEKDNAYLLQFVDSAYWTTQAAFETFPVIHFRKRPRKLYLKKKRSAKAKSKRHPMKP
jgi:hypothetical protein